MAPRTIAELDRLSFLRVRADPKGWGGSLARPAHVHTAARRGARRGPAARRPRVATQPPPRGRQRGPRPAVARVAGRRGFRPFRRISARSDSPK